MHGGVPKGWSFVQPFRVQTNRQTENKQMAETAWILEDMRGNSSPPIRPEGKWAPTFGVILNPKFQRFKKHTKKWNAQTQILAQIVTIFAQIAFWNNLYVFDIRMSPKILGPSGVGLDHPAVNGRDNPN